MRVLKIKINKQNPKAALKQGFKRRDPSLKGNLGKCQQKREEGRLAKEVKGLSSKLLTP